MSAFYQPTRQKDALELLASEQPPTILAGGTDLVVQRREGKSLPKAYLDITRLENIRLIEETDTGSVRLGAGVTFTEMENNTLLQERFPLLCRAAALVGSPQIRSRGTVGGNVANASPAADVVPALVALDAVACVENMRGARQILVSELITGMGKTALEKDELLTAFLLPPLPPMTKQGYDKLGRRNALSISRLNAAAALSRDGEKIAVARLCLGSATARPQRFTEVENLITGCVPDDALFTRAGTLAAEIILRETGQRASSVYKLPVAAEFTTALLRRVWEETK